MAALLAWCVGCGGTGTGGGGGAGSNANGAALNMDPHVQHCLTSLNAFRAQHGASALSLDDQLTAFAYDAASMLQAGGAAHGYFKSEADSGDIWKRGFCGNAGENQTGAGWKVDDEDATIDAVLQAMMDEGPGGGHYENIVNTGFTRVGVGLIVGSDKTFYMSNDFSGNCQ
jgi:uncharacterized protein YkwD